MITMKNTFTFVVLCCSAAMISSQFTCDPVDDCNSFGVGAYVPDPYFCNKYYICLNGPTPSDTSNVCATYYYFKVDSTGTSGQCVREAVSNVCDEEYCGDKRNQTCFSDCVKNGDLIGDAKDCSKYYICSPSGPIPQTCSTAPNLYFNGKTCVSSRSECCNFCVPFCYQPGVYQIADPKNCKKYYICEKQGTPKTNPSCFVDDHFDNVQSICVPGATCTNIC